MKGRILLYLSVLLFLMACKKEDDLSVTNVNDDFRANYIGNYNFTLTQEVWQLGKPYEYDTISYNGYIKKFEVGDEINDLSVGSDDSNYEDSRLTIEFLDGRIITPILAKNGVFIGESGYHYHCTGGFIGQDSLEFVVEDLGGMGGGVNFKVYGGRRK